MVKIIQDIIPKGNSNRPCYPMTPRYITVHTTANQSKGANALAHARYLKNGGAGTSWHFTVDDTQIVQHLPTNECGWHAGDGRNGTGNRQSIGIEICENADGNFEKAVANAIGLIVHLMREHNIPISRVVPHKHWTGKQCPRPLLGRWNWFISEIKRLHERSDILLQDWQREAAEEALKALCKDNILAYANNPAYWIQKLREGTITQEFAWQIPVALERINRKANQALGR